MKKILKIFGFAFIALLVIAIITFISLNLWTGSILEREHSDQENILGTGEKQALLIYQPSNGDTAETVSHEIANSLVANGYTVTINVPLKNLKYDISKYDLIVLGSPVYFGKVSPLVEDFVSNNSIDNKEVVIFVTGSVLDENKEELEMESWLNSTNNVHTIKTNKKELDNLKYFLDKQLIDLE